MNKIYLALMLCFVSIIGFAQESNSSINFSRKVNDFTDEITISSFIRIGPRTEHMDLIKHISPNGRVVYYLYISIKDSYCTVGIKGLTILFEDGTKFNRPNDEIDTNYYAGDEYNYSVLIRLSESEVKIFSQKEIRKFKMYIFERDITDYDVDEFKEIAGNIVTMK